jgi:hypothetical protein
MAQATPTRAFLCPQSKTFYSRVMNRDLILGLLTAPRVWVRIGGCLSGAVMVVPGV